MGWWHSLSRLCRTNLLLWHRLESLCHRFKELSRTVPHGPLAHPQSMKSQWGGRPCPPYKTAQVENLCHRKNFSGQGFRGDGAEQLFGGNHLGADRDHGAMVQQCAWMQQ